MCKTHVMKSLELGLFLPLVKCFLFVASHVWSTWCHKSFPNTLPIRGRHVKRQDFVQYDATLQKLVSLVLYIRARLHQFCQKPMSLVLHPKATSILHKAMSLVLYPKLCQFCKNLCHLCYIPSYVNFAKTYVTCVMSQAMSILQKPISFVLYLRLCQFCKNLCHLCYILGYVNFAKTYVICVIS